jgi:hypothetical protein
MENLPKHSQNAIGSLMKRYGNKGGASIYYTDVILHQSR